MPIESSQPAKRVARAARGRSRRRASPDRHPSFEKLEDRRVLATLTVTTLTDAEVTGPNSAPGTLRQAVYDANASADLDEIEFAAGLSGDLKLIFADDVLLGPSALVVSTQIVVRGNSSGITITRDETGAEMRFFRVTAEGALTLESISVKGGVARGASGSETGEAGGLGRGGAVLNQGTLDIRSSTLYANTALGGAPGTGGPSGPARGGAIYNDGGTLTVTNSTFSGNSVSSGGVAGAAGTFGGAIYTFNGNVAIHNSTLTNSVAHTGRGLYVFAQNGTATVDLQSSILGQSDAHFTARDFLTAPDVNGQIIVTGANNLIRVQGDFHYITESIDDPKLGPLMNHGGPTMTHEPATDSPVIDAGSNVQDLAVDQRGDGFGRMIGADVDIGAFEVQTAAAPSVPGDYNRDDVVDAADFVVWRMSVGAMVPKFSGADGDGDGDIDNADYGVWRSRFGQMLSAGAGAAMLVPVTGGQRLEAESTSGEASASAMYVEPFVMWVARGQAATASREVESAERAPEEPSPIREQNLLVCSFVDLPRRDFAAVPSKVSSDGSDPAVFDAVFDAWGAGMAFFPEMTLERSFD